MIPRKQTTKPMSEENIPNIKERKLPNIQNYKSTLIIISMTINHPKLLPDGLQNMKNICPKYPKTASADILKVFTDEESKITG